jgi:hypothetical protein
MKKIESPHFFRAENRSVEARDLFVVLVCYVDDVACDRFSFLDFGADRRQCIVELNGFDMCNAGLDADALLSVAVGCERQSGIRKRIGDATVGDPRSRSACVPKRCTKACNGRIRSRER